MDHISFFILSLLSLLLHHHPSSSSPHLHDTLLPHYLTPHSLHNFKMFTKHTLTSKEEEEVGDDKNHENIKHQKTENKNEKQNSVKSDKNVGEVEVKRDNEKSNMANSMFSDVQTDNAELERVQSKNNNKASTEDNREKEAVAAIQGIESDCEDLLTIEQTKFKELDRRIEATAEHTDPNENALLETLEHTDPNENAWLEKVLDLRNEVVQHLKKGYLNVIDGKLKDMELKIANLESSAVREAKQRDHESIDSQKKQRRRTWDALLRYVESIWYGEVEKMLKKQRTALDKFIESQTNHRHLGQGKVVSTHSKELLLSGEVQTEIQTFERQINQMDTFVKNKTPNENDKMLLELTLKSLRERVRSLKRSTQNSLNGRRKR